VTFVRCVAGFAFRRRSTLSLIFLSRIFFEIGRTTREGMPDQFMLIVARYRNTFMNVRNEFDNAEKCFAAPRTEYRSRIFVV